MNTGSRSKDIPKCKVSLGDCAYEAMMGNTVTVPLLIADKSGQQQSTEAGIVPVFSARSSS